MKQQRSWCSFLNYKLPLVLMSVTILAVMLIGFLTGASESMGKRDQGERPPSPISDSSHHQSSISRDHGMQLRSADRN